MYHPAGPQKDRGEFEDDCIPSYLSRLTQTALLTAEEERELARRVRRGDEGAKKRLIEANMRLVVNIAKNYRNRSIPFEDLVQEGAIGLMNAVDRFDPERGYRFSTYATHWIRQTIGRALDFKARIVRVPAHVSEVIRKMDRERERLFRENGRKPSLDEIAAALGVPAKRLLTILQCSKEPVSLDLMVGNNDQTALVSLLATDDESDPEFRALQRATVDELNELLEGLNEREREIVRRRIGLAVGASTEDISDLNLSRERVRQIEIQALRKLRLIASRRKFST